jgi:hypothetical protein
MPAMNVARNGEIIGKTGNTGNEGKVPPVPRIWEPGMTSEPSISSFRVRSSPPFHCPAAVTVRFKVVVVV